MALTCGDLRRLSDAEASLNTAEARQHLEGCADCRAAVRRWSEAETKLREWREQEPPAFLHARLMAHVRAAGRERVPERHVLQRFWWAPTLATVLLVALVVMRAPIRPSPEAPASTAPQTHLPPQAPHPAVPRGRAVPPPGLVRGAPSRAERTLTCELSGPADEGTTRSVALVESWAPPPGVAWAIVVEPTGEVRPETKSAAESGGAPKPVRLETLEALAALNLAPGRYVLRRSAS